MSMAIIVTSSLLRLHDADENCDDVDDNDTN